MAGMARSQQYRQKALACVSEAQHAESDKARTHLVNLGLYWMRMAEFCEYGEPRHNALHGPNWPAPVAKRDRH